MQQTYILRTGSVRNGLRRLSAVDVCCAGDDRWRTDSDKSVCRAWVRMCACPLVMCACVWSENRDDLRLLVDWPALDTRRSTRRRSERTTYKICLRFLSYVVCTECVRSDEFLVFLVIHYYACSVFTCMYMRSYYLNLKVLTDCDGRWGGGTNKNTMKNIDLETFGFVDIFSGSIHY